jgi:hypothetical protein
MPNPTEAKMAGSLSKDERRQLLVYHVDKLRSLRRIVDKAREPLKAAQEDFTAQVNAAKADLGKGYTRKYLTRLLEDGESAARDQVAEETRRAQDREALGLPVFGVQADLFDSGASPVEVRDELQWEAEGYLRGRNGALQEVPDNCPPRFEQAVMRGYERGQKATQDDILAAADFIAKRDEPAPVPAVDLTEEDQEDLMDEKVRRLKRSDFMKRGAEAPEAAIA